MPRRPLALALTLALALVAGCFGGEETPATRTVSASGGKASLGWDYAGEAYGDAAATLEGTLDDPGNAGNVTVAFTLAGKPYVATFASFAQAEGKDFMDGGIEFELDEHGDTGVADASIPRIHAIVAAWGKATLTREGAPLTPEPWTAHLMVSADTVRGPDGKIAKADGATPYDPATPGDARRIEGDPQALLFLKHPQGETYAPAPVNGTDAFACTGPACEGAIAIPFEAGATGAQVLVTVDGGSSPVGAGEVTLSLVTEEGTAVAGSPQQPVLPGQPVQVSYGIAPADIPGPLTLQVSGAGAWTASVTYTSTSEVVPFIVLTWDEVTVS